jgi:hypothetical protein
MKFSIRDLLLVTVIVALAVGWWVDRAALTARVERLERFHRIQLMQRGSTRDGFQVDAF